MTTAKHNTGSFWLQWRESLQRTNGELRDWNSSQEESEQAEHSMMALKIAVTPRAAGLVLLKISPKTWCLRLQNYKIHWIHNYASPLVNWGINCKEEALWLLKWLYLGWLRKLWENYHSKISEHPLPKEVVSPHLNKNTNLLCLKIPCYLTQGRCLSREDSALTYHSPLPLNQSPVHLKGTNTMSHAIEESVYSKGIARQC